jgi:hypothetical protein
MLKNVVWRWEHGSNGRAPVLQAQGPEFKLYYHKKVKKKVV